MTRPQLWLVAGPNGSGKSSLSNRFLADRIEVIDPDAIARRIAPDNPLSPAVALRAGRKALIREQQLLDGRESFARETTLSGSQEMKLARDARATGYKVNLIYLCTNDPKFSIFRIDQRAANGGHRVPDQDVIRRYRRSLENLPRAIKEADRAWLIDNTGIRPRLIASLERDRVKGFPRALPHWVKDAKIPALEMSQGLGR